MRKSVEDITESFRAEIKDLKSCQAEIRNAITKMQTQMDTITARMDEAEEQISDTEDKIMENNEAKKKRETKVMDHNGNSVTLLKQNNIWIIGVQEDEEREKGAEGLCE